MDFWRLIWQEKPVSVVMVTNLKEGAKGKCEQYWPNSTVKHEEFGPFTVTLLDEQVLPDFTFRKMSVTVRNYYTNVNVLYQYSQIQDGSNQSHSLTQYHLTSWPDHGVPSSGMSLVYFTRAVRKVHPQNDPRPLLVHCSAGVGRTGTYIVIDNVLDQIAAEGVVDISGAIVKARNQRMKLVQTQVTRGECHYVGGRH